MEKMKVVASVLGKGTDTITLKKNATVRDARQLLALDADVQASDKQGNEMKDTDVITGDINFAPNVAGGQ